MMNQVRFHVHLSNTNARKHVKEELLLGEILLLLPEPGPSNEALSTSQLRELRTKPTITSTYLI